VCIAVGLNRESRLADLSHRLGQSPNPPGVVLTFSDKFSGMRLVSGWAIVLFTRVARIAGNEFVLSPTSIQQAFTGKNAASDGRPSDEDWKAVVKIYQSIRSQKPRHYTAAKKLRSMSAIARKWGERQLADKLKQAFPEDFR
jgi:hypothetical protein